MSLGQDFRFSSRALLRRPALSLGVIATLGLGIGASTAVFSFVHALLLRGMPFQEPERLVAIQAYKNGELGRVSQREIDALRQDSRALASVASYYTSQYAMVGDGDPQQVVASIHSHELFETLGLELTLGEGLPAEQDYRRQYNVVLGYGLWRERFGGDPSIIGRSVTLDGAPYLVEGVAPAGLEFPSKARLYRQVTDFHGLDGRIHSVVARLATGASLREAEEELRRLSRQWERDFPGTNAGVYFEVTPLRDQYVASARPYLMLLAAAVGLVFAVACFNVMNLLLNRAFERRAELSLRSALGAGRTRLVRQAFLESLVLALPGGLLGVGVAAVCIRALSGLTRLDLPGWMSVELDGAALLFALAASALSGAAVGVAPAVAALGAKPGEGLKDGSRPGASGPWSGRVRRALVTAELALATMLLVAAGLLLRSSEELARLDPGFAPQDVLTFRVDPPWSRYSTVEQTTPFYNRTLEALRALPGVTAAGANHDLPLAGIDQNSKRVITVQGKSVDQQESVPFVHLQSVSDGYFDAMRIPVREGRPVEAGDGLGSYPVAVISASLAEALWPGESALHRRLRLGPPDARIEPDPANPAATDWLTVVGVAEDVQSERLTGPPGFDLYVSNRQFFTGDSFFALRTRQDPLKLVAAAERAIQQFDSDLPLFDVAAMEERVADAEWQRRVASVLFVAFGVATLLLAAIGVYGVTAESVRLRVRELGVRMAVGASPTRLLRMVLQEGLRLTLLGGAVGLAIAAVGVSRLRELLFGVEPFDTASFAGAAVLLLVIAAAACFEPALRASRLRPVKALRGD